MLNFKIRQFHFKCIPIFCLLFIAGKCTDEGNHNPNAKEDEKAIATEFTPKFNLPKEIKESSGLLYFDNAIWTHNDGGNKPVLYKLDPETGKY